MPTIYSPVEPTAVQREIHAAAVALVACHEPPTVAAIAKFTELPINQVKAEIKALQEIGLLKLRRVKQ